MLDWTSVSGDLINSQITNQLHVIPSLINLAQTIGLIN